MAEAAITSLLRHTWYLTEELVVFCLWDEQLPANERSAVATSLARTNPPAEWSTGKPVLPDHLPARPRLQNLVGARSWMIFHLLQIGTAWLQRPVRRWTEDPEYMRVQEFLKDLKVVNDIAEQCVKDITEYANTAKDSAHRDEILLVVNDHRFALQDLRRGALANANLY